LFQHSLKANEYGHVYTLHAEMEGMKLLPAMDQLIQNLIAGEQQFQTLADRHAYLSGRGIPRLPMKWAEIEGRSGELAMGSV
ncbi:MAG: 4-deoxy-4-formamido-L-arabinose-phosphoundecaprenol deformylase, partial [Gammaproteobacteria bacterium]|nr:4-deoxy-4-formamido-L-arabinose-phosphoundecaprenol deformylase [Gammaproteobacteria bacterium]